MDGLVVRGHVIGESELRWRFSRSDGPGGQSVNTTDSRVELSYDLVGSSAFPVALRDRALAALAPRLVGGALTVSASEHRSQWRNRQAALRRLQRLLEDATAPPRAVRRPTRPSARARQRRVETKRRHGDLKRARRRPPPES